MVLVTAALVLQDVFPLKEVVQKGKGKGKKTAADIWKERSDCHLFAHTLVSTYICAYPLPSTPLPFPPFPSPPLPFPPFPSPPLCTAVMVVWMESLPPSNVD